MHVLGFHLTGNSNVYSTMHTEQNARKHQNFTLLILSEENPLVTNGLASQRASNAKALIMQFHDCRSIFVSSILWKKYILAATMTLNEHQRISYHWQLYCLLNSQYRKHKRKHQSSARLLPCGEKPSVTNGISTQRVSNVKNRSSCNFSVSGTFVLSSVSQR